MWNFFSEALPHNPGYQTSIPASFRLSRQEKRYAQTNPCILHSLMKNIKNIYDIEKKFSWPKTL